MSDDDKKQDDSDKRSTPFIREESIDDTDSDIGKDPSLTAAGDEAGEPGQSSSAQDPWTQSPRVTEPTGTTQEEASKSADKTTGKKGLFGGRGKQQLDLSGDDWERDILNRLAFASLNEQRRARRWGVFFKALAFIYVGAVLFYLPSDLGQKGLAGGKHTAVIEIKGAIADDTEASADNIVSGLRDAFKNKNTAGIILRINSPGGSPVQAGYVYDEIKRLRKKYPDTKLYAVVTDMCASGGYYIAVAADEIYANKASIVGSIGVLMNGFGFVETMEKLGVERRLVTAGEHKGALDPFSPIKKDELKHVQSLLNDVHQQFIDVVKEGRGDRLVDSPDIFSGLFWNGEQGLKLGLVDGL
ncbi:MAG: S49 family peptidase, partial [Gammaproteobacteria bacterium]